MSDLYHVSSSPHVRSKDTTSKIMLYVIMALLPTSLFGIYNFGIRALILILVTIASCVASEWIFNKIVHKKNSINDLSAVVTGLLLALNLPASLPWWEAVIGGVFAIVIVKMMFGGLGQNFMNPALGARFLTDRICSGYDKLHCRRILRSNTTCTDEKWGSSEHHEHADR